MPETGVAEKSLVHTRPGTGEVVHVLGEELRVMLGASATNARLSLIEINSPPNSGPPAVHTHPPAEAFYVLEGTVEFSQMGADGIESFIAGPGSVVYVPSGAPHNYKNVGETNSRMLGIFSSIAMENFFHDMERATTDDDGNPIFPPDVPKLMGVMAKHDVAFVGGPPGQN